MTPHKIGFLNIEYFDENGACFGGYGMTSKLIMEHFNANGSPLRFEMLLTRHAHRLSTKRVGSAEIILAPSPDAWQLGRMWQYTRFLNRLHLDLLLALEYYPQYWPALRLLPKTPVLVWIHDPRPEESIERIATVPLEMLANGKRTVEEFKRPCRDKRESIQRLMATSRRSGRPVLFATMARWLTPLARTLYGLPEIEPFFLPIPVGIPPLTPQAVSPSPSVCFLGRLDPIKRPWIFFELAKRFPQVEFLVAGVTDYPDIMNPIIHRYTDVPNLKFLGLVTGAEKAALLNRVWAVVNTSVHESLSVSLLEAFAYGKPFICSQNPDQLVERFGVYTGELPGEGLDERTLGAFAHALERLLANDEERIAKGHAGRQCIAEHYSFERFEQALRGAVSSVGAERKPSR